MENGQSMDNQRMNILGMLHPGSSAPSITLLYRLDLEVVDAVLRIGAPGNRDLILHLID